jgi:hypothetical protein
MRSQTPALVRTSRRASANTGRFSIPIRITLLRPPTGVSFCVQGRDQELLKRTESAGQDLSFDLTILAGRVDGTPRFFGDLTQGPPASRFIYVCSGSLAGQAESCWTRRAKVPLSGITWASVERLQRGSGARLEARFDGTAKDGGPACATVKLLEGGWRLMP